jgi:hypothetical protein
MSIITAEVVGDLRLRQRELMDAAPKDLVDWETYHAIEEAIESIHTGTGDLHEIVKEFLS